MGYLPTDVDIQSADALKLHLNPYADNDTIRNSIFQFAETHPEKKISLLSSKKILVQHEPMHLCS